MAANPQPISQPAAVAPEKKGWDKWAPTTKVSVGVAAGALATLIVPFLAPHWKSWTGSDWAPANVVAPLTAILTFGIQYIVPERK